MCSICLLTLICKPKSALTAIVWSRGDTPGTAKAWRPRSQLRRGPGMRRPLFRLSHHKPGHTICVLVSAMVLTVLCFLLTILLFKTTPKHSAEVPSSVPKCKKAVRKRVLGKLHLGPVHKVFLHRGANETRVQATGWWKRCGRRPAGTWACIPSRSDALVFAKSVFLATR